MIYYIYASRHIVLDLFQVECFQVVARTPEDAAQKFQAKLGSQFTFLGVTDVMPWTLTVSK